MDTRTRAELDQIATRTTITGTEAANLLGIGGVAASRRCVAVNYRVRRHGKCRTRCVLNYAIPREWERPEPGHKYLDAEERERDLCNGLSPALFGLRNSGRTRVGAAFS